jgi:uncharacterized protein YdhG (YjbR/CyaY superfamily)
MSNPKRVIQGGVDEYIDNAPVEVQELLRNLRSAIKDIAPDAIETVSYFQIPGYSYPGYRYNGMFAWISYKESYVRLHVIPPVLENHAKLLTNYITTKSVVSFPVDNKLPIALIKELVSASIRVMKYKVD